MTPRVVFAAYLLFIVGAIVYFVVIGSLQQ